MPPTTIDPNTSDSEQQPTPQPQEDIGHLLTVRERISYGLGDMGANIVFSYVGSFVLFYLTDYVGIGAAIAGTLLLFGRVLDGTMDIVVGSLIDKTRSRWGKARPWVLFSMPVLLISFVLLFAVPEGLSEQGASIYVFVFYFLCLGVGFTASNLSYHTLLSLMTTHTKMRVSSEVIRTVCSGLGGIFVLVATIPLITALGNQRSSWAFVAIGYALLAGATILVTFWGTRERVLDALVRERVKVGASMRHLFTNRYFFLAFVMFFLFYAQNGLGSVGIYIARDVIGNASFFSVLALIGLLPAMATMWFMPGLVNRYGKRNLVLAGVILSLLGTGVVYIDPHSVGLLVTGSIVRALALMPLSITAWTFVADAVDYGEWRTGKRLDGMTFAAATAGQNFGAGLGSAAVGWLLAVGGYMPNAAQQSPQALNMQIFIFAGLPAILSVAIGAVVFFMDLDRSLPQIHRDLAARRS
ncbi:MFS transporter [Leifsonia aquatica]|uniref:MFS transporter n=1 Tax=Leifsonia aquatica TaxID=144185 RepID=UPI00046946D8|nr:glycoside-pentoside-hexuronide (GPH):cation symporter [Leifsonia aquatica]